MITDEHIRNVFDSSDVAARRALSIQGYSHAGVLVPLVRRESGFDLLFTKRTESVETHKGQVSFPGGMVDASDSDIVRTALRESEEEIGLSPSYVEVVGLLDDMATPTGFVITPVVGIIDHLPVLTPNNDEVAEVFRAELDFFAKRANGRSEVRKFQGRQHEVWYYDWQERVIWGATAAMVRALLRKLQLGQEGIY